MNRRGQRSDVRTVSRIAARRPERWLYATGALLWASGLGWLASHYLASSRDAFGELSHPWDAVWLRLHGAAMLAFLVALGALLPTHIVPAWRRRTNRRSGLVMLVVVAALALTGYGLYYAGDEQLRPWISAIHWGVGLGAAAALLAHRALGRRRQAKRARTLHTRALNPNWTPEPGPQPNGD